MSTSWTRIGAVAGVVFAFLLFFSVTTVDPLRQASDAQLLEWWSVDANLQATLISTCLAWLSLPFFLTFLVQLRSKLRAEEGPEGWSELVFASGLVFAATMGIADTMRGVIAYSVKLSDEPLPSAEMLRFATEFSQLTVAVVAMSAVVMMMGVAAVIILRNGTLARWVGWLGLPLTALSLVAVVLQAGGWAIPLVLIWVLAASYSLFRGTKDVGTELVDSGGGASAPLMA